MSCASALADDWNQWLGPNRDSVWNEDGVVQSIPASGLKPKLKIPVGAGYSSPSVVKGIIYLTDFTPGEKKLSDNPGVTASVPGTERVRAIDSKTGKVLWTHEYPEGYTISYASGPRVQPTVVGGQVFTIGAQGQMLALDASTGKVIWEKRLEKEFGPKPPQWGYASAPLVDGDLVFANVGNEKGAAVAIDRNTGKTVWQSAPAKEPGYAPPAMIERGGRKELLMFNAEGLNSIDPKTGRVNWSYPLAPDHGMAIAPPRVDGNLLFVGGAPRESIVLRLTDDKPQLVWHQTGKTAIRPANSAPFIDKGIIYGADGVNGSFRAVGLLDGEQIWESFKPTTGTRRSPYGTSFIVKNAKNGLFYLFSETGDLIIAKLTDKGYQEIGRQHLVDPTTDAFGREVAWSAPAFADRSLFVKNDNELVMMDLAKDSYPDGGPAAGVVEQAEEEQKATVEEAGTHVLNMIRFGSKAYFDLMKNPEQAKQFTKNDLWTHVDVTTVHKDVFPSISYLYNFFPDNYAASQNGKAPAGGKSAIGSLIAKLTGGKPAATKDFVKSDAFLDKLEEAIAKVEEQYRKARTSAKEVKGPDIKDFQSTKDQWYPQRTDKDPELWKLFSEMAALEYYLYRLSETDIDLTQKYKTEVSVRVRDPNSKKTLNDYFKWSSNPKRAADLARRMAKLEKNHLSLYGMYVPLRELLVRFLAYHWEFHDLLLPDEVEPGLGVVNADTHTGEK